MSRERQSTATAAPALAGLCLVLIALVLYVAGYFWLCETTIGAWDKGGTVIAGTIRKYPHLTLALLYYPAGILEDWFVEDGILIDAEITGGGP